MSAHAEGVERSLQVLTANCFHHYIGSFTDIVGDALRTGRLKTLLDDWKTPATDIFAVLGVGRYVPSKTQVFVDFLVERFRGTPDWDVDW